MAEDSTNEQKAPIKAPRDRSPAYPFISLKSAVDRLAAFDATFGRHPAPAEKVGLAWKMKEKSSQAFQTLAALKSYGLVDYKGSSADRVAMLTEDGRNYLRAQQQSVKQDILKRAALRPRAIANYWQMWGADRPIDPICLDELMLKGGYTDSAAHTFLRVYDETVDFAGLSASDSTESSEDVDEVFEAEETVNHAHHPVPTVPVRHQVTPAAPPTAVLTPSAGFLDESYPLDGGRAFVVRRPEVLSAAELDEFDAWIALLQRKMKRLIQQ